MLWRISVPVLVANLIAWPVAYYYLHRWLEELRVPDLPRSAVLPGQPGQGRC